jgi:MFS family permease
VFIGKGIKGLTLIRACIGATQAFHYPTLNQIFSEYLPSHLKTRMVGVNQMMTAAGIIFANLFIPLLNEYYGWPLCFYLLGFTGLIVAYFWKQNASKLQSLPKKHTIRPETSFRISQLFQPPLLAIYLAQFSFNWGFFIMFSWLPTYLTEELHFQSEKMGVLSAFFYFAMASFAPLASFLSEKLAARYSTLTIRKLSMGICFGSQILLMELIKSTTSPSLIITFLFLSMGLGQFQTPGNLSNILEVAPENTGLVFGLVFYLGFLMVKRYHE